MIIVVFTLTIIIRRSEFFVLFPDLPLSRARIVGADTGCKLNKSTFAGDCARAFEIENIRHFRQSQFIRRFRGPPRFVHPIFPASADGRRLRLRGKYGLFERFTMKFTGKFAGFPRMRPFLPFSRAWDMKNLFRV